MSSDNAPRTDVSIVSEKPAYPPGEPAGARSPSLSAAVVPDLAVAVDDGARDRYVGLSLEQRRQCQHGGAGRHGHDREQSERHRGADGHGDTDPPGRRTSERSGPGQERRERDRRDDAPGGEPPDEAVVDPERRRVHHDHGRDAERDPDRSSVAALEPVEHHQHDQDLRERTGQELEQTVDTTARRDHQQQRRDRSDTDHTP
ncbi:MAG: hypothetical protein R2697_05945 [Ilumatobacteraceae bacterium]